MRTAARSDPAWGSVKFMVPIHSPLISFDKYKRRCSSVPCRVNANTALRVSMGPKKNAMLAPFQISDTGCARTCGNPCPPNAGSPCSAGHPASINCLYASFVPGGVVTAPSFHLQPILSPTAFNGLITFVANLPASSSTASTSSAVTSPLPGKAVICSSSQSCLTTNCKSRIGAMYSAMLILCIF